MAAVTSHLCYTSPLKFSLPKLPSTQRAAFLSQSKKRTSSSTRIMATGPDLLGDFGARDPFPEEIESQFGEKVLGNVSTEHKILIQNASALSLAQQDCSPISPRQKPMSEDEAKKLLFKFVGWRLINVEGGLRLQCLWKLRHLHCGIELISRINKAIEDTGHFPNLHLEQPNQVRAELWTSSIDKQMCLYQCSVECAYFFIVLLRVQVSLERRMEYFTC